jgi:hypothetical protein
MIIRHLKAKGLYVFICFSTMDAERLCRWYSFTYMNGNVIKRATAYSITYCNEAKALFVSIDHAERKLRGTRPEGVFINKGVHVTEKQEKFFSCLILATDGIILDEVVL